MLSLVNSFLQYCFSSRRLVLSTSAAIDQTGGQIVFSNNSQCCFVLLLRKTSFISGCKNCITQSDSGKTLQSIFRMLLEFFKSCEESLLSFLSWNISFVLLWILQTSSKWISLLHVWHPYFFFCFDLVRLVHRGKQFFSSNWKSPFHEVKMFVIYISLLFQICSNIYDVKHQVCDCSNLFRSSWARATGLVPLILKTFPILIQEVSTVLNIKR